MAIVIAALLPVFLLIVLGFGLKRSLMRLETQWHGLERLTYYVLFPALLIQTLVKADLSSVPVAGVGGALVLSELGVSLVRLGLRTLLSSFAVDGLAFPSIFQGATRWQTYVALAVSGNLHGEIGLALASVAMVAIIPLVNVFSVAVFLKLILMPVLAIALALWFGLSGSNLSIVAACSAVPASSSAYVLARQIAATRPCWRKSSRCRPFLRRSRCRSQLRWWRRSSLRAQRSIEQQS